MIDQMLLAVALGRYEPNDVRVGKQLGVLVDQNLVVKTADGWKLTVEGGFYLSERGWDQCWVRQEPFRRSLRPGVFATPEEAKDYDKGYVEHRMVERALIRPVFVNRQRGEWVM